VTDTPPTDVPATGRVGATSYAATSYDDVPLNRFHLKITALTFCANFSDGYELGIIGIALPLLSPQLHAGAIWQGLIGASALVGIFLGSMAVAGRPT
jgi:putative MFS transporter